MLAVADPHKLQCPVHHVPEVNPDTDKLFIRAYKVTDGGHIWSQCLICSGFYQIQDGAVVETPHNHNPNKGWFHD